MCTYSLAIRIPVSPLPASRYLLLLVSTVTGAHNEATQRKWEKVGSGHQCSITVLTSRPHDHIQRRGINSKTDGEVRIDETRVVGLLFPLFLGHYWSRFEAVKPDTHFRPAINRLNRQSTPGVQKLKPQWSRKLGKHCSSTLASTWSAYGNEKRSD
jgi:hypothetical protein